MKKVRIFITVIAAILGFIASLDVAPFIFKIADIPQTQFSLLAIAFLGGVFTAIIFYYLSSALSRKIAFAANRMELYFQRVPLRDIVVSIGGLVAGLVLANLASLPLLRVPLIGNFLPIILNIVFGYLGLLIAWKKRNDVTVIRQTYGRKKGDAQSAHEPDNFIKILDTSVIIDGRIADIADTGILEGAIVVPAFVIQELQYIADSDDIQRRNRGRRGLDILSRMQKSLGSQIVISEEDFPDVPETDRKLVNLGQKYNAKIVTNDYNLNKVCSLHGIDVLNINELANAVKAVILPGETMKVLIIRAGKERNQGIGYLDDGTMVVVEEGKSHINSVLTVEVTSALQTAAGRMIFAKLP